MSNKDNALLTLKAHNPPIDLKFDHHQTTTTGLGQASSQKVQFNVNRAADAGTIFVQGKNSGIVVATLHSDHIFVNFWWAFDPEGGGLWKNPKKCSFWGRQTKRIINPVKFVTLTAV